MLKLSNRCHSSHPHRAQRLVVVMRGIQRDQPLRCHVIKSVKAGLELL